jgi:pimeloyl-ACP methyl ester carboxylesterase
MKRQNIPLLETQNIGDVDMPYLSYGNNGTPLILLHATGFISWLWHPIAEELSSAYRVIAPHIVDYRVADPRKGGLPWMTIAEDMAFFCDKMGIENPCLVGHSMGATVLTLAVARYGLAAQAMILVEPIFLPPEFYRAEINVEDHPLAAKAIKRINYWEDASEAMTYLKSKTLFAKWHPEMLQLYADYGMRKGQNGGLELVCSPETEASLFMGGVQFDPWPLLSRVSCPVLVVGGQESDNDRFVDIQKAVSAFPRASHRAVAGAGHLIPMEKPDETVAIIKDFFGRYRRIS